MGTTKETPLYGKEILRFAKVLKAVAHPARLEILIYLQDQGGACNKELYEHIGLSQSTVSEHLNKLKEVNLIKTVSYENTVQYSLHTELCQEIVKGFGLLLLLSE